MPTVLYTPKFVRQWKKLESDLQEEVERCLAELRKNPKLPSLKVHKLTGTLKGFLSCSVNYKYRIVFEWDDPKTIAVLSVGDHDVYR
ncbi:type II toxin-antitoxin system mRNA interferase toxin, RelE/StbE family [Candidatus Peribacteria bacterium]|nr:type II toxin-antitoxin system mRNA interferase toxin, RelE/StbE family [Candidatus Peribacteria bacterium]